MAAEPRRVGIKNVAEAAGVSVTTVSHALNGKGRLPERTREHVRRVAEELGYRPNVQARNLVGGRTGLLGLAVTQPAGARFPLTDLAYYVQLTNAATAAAMRRGYAVVLAPDGGGAGVWEHDEVDGAIVIDPTASDPLVLRLRARGLPVVTTGRVVDDDEAAPWVDNDHAEATDRVLDHLDHRGARRIALVSSQPDSSFTMDTEAAYEAWCGEHGKAPLVCRAAQDLDQDAAAAAAAMAFDAEPPADAVYATLDRLALATAQAAQARGLAVPDDVQIVSATDSEAARWAHPPLTVLDLSPEEIGRRAADLLVDLLGPSVTAPAQRYVESSVIARGSTRPGPAD
jgi:DNA-binding LacI/PurR family transcriptional regulator